MSKHRIARDPWDVEQDQPDRRVPYWRPRRDPGPVALAANSPSSEDYEDAGMDEDWEDEWR